MFNEIVKQYHSDTEREPQELTADKATLTAAGIETRTSFENDYGVYHFLRVHGKRNAKKARALLHIEEEV